MVLCLLWLRVSSLVANEDMLDIGAVSQLLNRIDQSEGAEKINLLLSFGQDYGAEEPKSVYKYSHSLLEQSDYLLSPAERFELILLKALACIKLGYFDEVLPDLINAHKIIQTQTDPNNFVRIKLVKGHFHLNKGEYRLAKESYLDAQEFTLELKNGQVNNQVEEALAIGLLSCGEAKKALHLFDELLIDCRPSQNDCLNLELNRCIALTATGLYPKAVKHIFAIRDKLKSGHNNFQLSITDHLLGYILHHINLRDKAQIFYHKAKGKFIGSGTMDQLSRVYENLGEFYSESNRIDSAIYYLNKAIEINLQHGYQNVGFNQLALADCYFKTKAFDQSLELIDLAITNFSEFNPDGKAMAAQLLAKHHLMNNELFLAENCLLAADSLFRKLELKNEMIENARLRSELYREQEDASKALTARIEMQELEKSIIQPKDIVSLTKELLNGHADEKGTLTASKHVGPLSWFLSLIIGIALIILLRFRLTKNIGAPAPKSRVEKEDALKIIQNLEGVMHSERPFLNPGLTLRNLALMCGTTEKKLSQVLNQYLTTNFYDFLNKYRIESFIQQYRLDQEKLYSIAGLALKCGFNSKSSFYRAFKKEKGCSPSAYFKK